MHAMAHSILLGALVALQGCASNELKITYHSDPPGATLYQDGQNMGYTPVTLYYQVSEEDRTRGYASYKGTAVRWVSGATAQISHIRADLSVGGRQQFNFIRPTGAPGAGNTVYTNCY